MTGRTRPVENPRAWIVDDLVRLSCLTYAQLARSTGRTKGAIRQLVGRMREDGLVESVDSLAGLVHRPTRLAFEAANVRARPVTVGGHNLAHTLRVADAALALRERGWLFFSEPEILARRVGCPPGGFREGSRRWHEWVEASDDWNRFTVPLAPYRRHDGPEPRHRPDLVVFREMSEVPGSTLPGRGRATAVEVELTAKSRARWRETLAAYEVSDEFAGVWYFTATRGQALSIMRLAAEHRFTKVTAWSIKG